ncbi:MAG: lipoyl(octanoyl) transferase LipB [Casimicrobiaceae bacterium]
MRAFTEARTADSADELWSVEHEPVYTLGVAGRPEHLLTNPRAIPVLRTDRGGQITYHGPGQAVVYVLFDLKRAGFGVRELVTRLEQAVIDLLAVEGIEGYARRDAPGVYLRLPGSGEEAKIAALGLKVRNGRTYHGLALNVSMDLAPFGFINPCGYAGMRVTQLADLGVEASLAEVAGRLTTRVAMRLSGVSGVTKSNHERLDPHLQTPRV